MEADHAAMLCAPFRPTDPQVPFFTQEEDI
jgi:hypothetical protein